MLKSISVCFIFLFFSQVAFAQDPDSVVYPQRVVPKDSLTIKSVRVTGNKVTKERIIYRELSFAINQKVSYSELPNLLEKTRQNLQNTSLFNFVIVNYVTPDSINAEVYIDVVERWYIFPLPIFELADRNFNIWWETKDFSRTNYGIYIVKENFRGRKERLRFILRMGYTRQFALAYDIPYINKKQNAGMAFFIGYAKNHEIGYKSENNRLIFFKDEDRYVRTELGSRIKYFYRKGIYDTHSIEARFNKAEITDTVPVLNRDYFTPNAQAIHFFGLAYNFKHDLRNSRAYPLKGYYFEADIAQYGLGILTNEKIDFLKTELVYRHYFKLSDRFYLASGLKGKLTTNNNQPYFLQRGLGYGDFVRGYEYYVVDGQNYGLGQVGVKYELVKPKKVKIPFIPFEKFNTLHYALYMELFTDAAYVSDKRFFAGNPLSNSFIYGNGIGLNYVTYYDKVLRLEYSINKLKESGIFIHFSAPIYL